MAPALRGYGKEFRELYSDFISMPRAEEIQYHQGNCQEWKYQKYFGLRDINLHYRFVPATALLSVH